MLGVDFDCILSPALLSCAVKAWYEIKQKQTAGDRVRFGKGWEGKISLNMGQENICPQLSLAHCLPHGTITGPRILAGMAPASHQYGICHVLVGVVPPAPCPRQTLPSGRCRHNHTESGAELGKNRNMIYF